MKKEKNKERKQTTTSWIVAQELHMEILSWLPAESCVSFMLVCKSWHTLVNNPDFIKLHLDRANAENRYNSLICESKRQLYKLEAPHYNHATSLVPIRDTDISPITESSVLVGSCNGLLCFIKDRDTSYLKLVVVNPSTRRYRELPEELPDKIYHNEDYYGKFEFPIHSFGYSSTADDYKVVRILFATDPNMSDEVKVYSLSTNSWRKVAGTRFCSCCYSRGVFFNEALHWMGSRIVLFDISLEMFRELPMPPDCHIEYMRKNLMILRGCLCMMISSTRRKIPCKYEIWAMKEYGVQESWTRQFVITSDHGSALYKILDPSTVYRKNDNLLIQDYFGRLIYYDMKTRRITKWAISDTCRATTLSDDGYHMHDCSHIGSLVSLSSKKRHPTKLLLVHDDNQGSSNLQ